MGERKHEKGDRVSIVGGRQGKGMRGEIFWIGESRYGKGSRYGVRGDDGQTYWVDEVQVGPEDAVPAPELPDREERPPLAKGARVRITSGEAAGAVGEVFWVGDSKFGRGMRYGVRGDDGQTVWADDAECELFEDAAPGPAGPSARAGDARPDDRAFRDDPPMPSDDDLAFRDDDAPMPDDADLALGEDEEVPF